MTRFQRRKTISDQRLAKIQEDEAIANFFLSNSEYLPGTGFITRKPILLLSLIAPIVDVLLDYIGIGECFIYFLQSVQNFYSVCKFEFELSLAKLILKI